MLTGSPVLINLPRPQEKYLTESTLVQYHYCISKLLEKKSLGGLCTLHGMSVVPQKPSGAARRRGATEKRKRTSIRHETTNKKRTGHTTITRTVTIWYENRDGTQTRLSTILVWEKVMVWVRKREK